MNITPDLVKKAVLAEDDFGHEMRVRRVLEDVQGAQVVHGWTYKDPQEGKPRQFDLRFTLDFPSLSRGFKLAVECKNLAPGAPLVVCGTNRTAGESFHSFTHSVLLEKDTPGGPQLFPEKAVRVVHGGRSYYKPDEFVGKSLLRFKPDQKEIELIRASSAQETEIYGRWSQALASADEMCKSSLQHNHGAPGIITILTLPFVVVPDGTLWQAHYDEGGALKKAPESVTHTTFFVNHAVAVRVVTYTGAHSVDYILSHLHFLTITGLRDFVGGLVGNVPVQRERWFAGS